MNVGDPVTVNADRSTRNGQAGTVVSVDWVECTISVQLKIDGAVLEYAPHHLIARMIDVDTTEPHAEQPTGGCTTSTRTQIAGSLIRATLGHASNKTTSGQNK